MEGLPSINEYQQYLNEQNAVFQRYLDEVVDKHRKALAEEKKQAFDEGLKDVLSRAQDIKSKAVERFNKDIERIKSVNDKEYQFRRQKEVQDDLSMRLYAAKHEVDDFLQLFSN